MIEAEIMCWVLPKWFMVTFSHAFLFLLAVSSFIPRRGAEYPLQLAPNTELDVEWTYKFCDHFLLLHKSIGATGI